MVKRISILDMLDLPFNVVHELYRKTFLKTQELAKQEEEKKRMEDEERRKQHQRERMNSNNHPTAPNIQVKQTPSTSSNTSTIPSGFTEDDIEELMEEGL